MHPESTLNADLSAPLYSGLSTVTVAVASLRTVSVFSRSGGAA